MLKQFTSNMYSGQEIGAQLCVYHKGDKVNNNNIIILKYKLKDHRFMRTLRK